MTLRVGSRTSALAIVQANEVAHALKQTGNEVELIPLESDQVPGDSNDKSRWVSRLERALLDNEIDIAVHSAKDVPGELPPGLKLASFFGRQATTAGRDLLYGAANLDTLPVGARIGTSSLRRRSQLLAANPELTVVPLRGNVDTRLKKVADGTCDAIVLSQQGLERLYLAAAAASTGRIADLTAKSLYEVLHGGNSCLLDPDRFVPAPGQGALAIEVRSDDQPALKLARIVGDRATEVCVQAERVVAGALSADCNSAVGVFSHLEKAGTELQITAFVGLSDGSQSIRDTVVGDSSQGESLGKELAERMLSVGAGELIAQGAKAL